MVMITLYARQKKRHRCIEQTFGLYGRRRGWDDLREQHQNMYIIIKCETDHQPRLDAWDKCSGLVHWEDPEGWDGEGDGRGGSGWGTHVNPWLIHVNVWQKPLQYCKVISLQLIKIIGKDKKEESSQVDKKCLQILRIIKGVSGTKVRQTLSYDILINSLHLLHAAPENTGYIGFCEGENLTPTSFFSFDWLLSFNKLSSLWFSK